MNMFVYFSGRCLFPWGLGCRAGVCRDRFWGEVTVNLLLRNVGMLAFYRASLYL